MTVGDSDLRMLAPFTNRSRTIQVPPMNSGAEAVESAIKSVRTLTKW